MLTGRASPRREDLHPTAPAGPRNKDLLTKGRSGTVQRFPVSLMKLLHLLIICTTSVAGLLPPVISAQRLSLPTTLSKMEDAEFATWLVGTEWQIPMGSDVYRAWFATPSLVVL